MICWMCPAPVNAWLTSHVTGPRLVMLRLERSDGRLASCTEPVMLHPWST